MGNVRTDPEAPKESYGAVLVWLAVGVTTIFSVGVGQRLVVVGSIGLSRLTFLVGW